MESRFTVPTTPPSGNAASKARDSAVFRPRRGRRYSPSETIQLAVAAVRADLRWLLVAPERRVLAARFEAAGAGTSRAGGGARTARRFMEVRAMSELLLREPALWSTVDYPEDRLGEALALGRGVVLTSIHSPTMWIAAVAGSTLFDYDVMWAVGDELLGDDASAPANEGAAVLASSPAEVIRVRETYAKAGQRLADGGAVGVLFDVPGPVEVYQLGKRTLVHPWFAKLARRHGSAILPCLGCWDRGHLSIRFGQVVIPSRGENIQHICQRVASSLELVWAAFPHHWSPYTMQLWPDDVGPYLWAFDDH